VCVCVCVCTRERGGVHEGDGVRDVELEAEDVETHALARDDVVADHLQAGSYLRLIDSCITQLQAQGPSRTCNESKEEEERRGVHLGRSACNAISGRGGVVN